MILINGIDSIYFSIKGKYRIPDKLYLYLDKLKEKSIKDKEDQQGSFDGKYFFQVMPRGSRGYEYILYSNEYCFKLMRTENEMMPNILLEIRSEKLWSIGLTKSVKEALKIIDEVIFQLDWVKISRVDMCCDCLIDKEKWKGDIIENKQSRAKRKYYYYDCDELEGLSIGSGSLVLRIYDKEKEIKKSGKEWFYNVWQINKDEVPEDKKIIRFEYQVRRELLKTFLISELDDLNESINSLWAYLTKDWFKILKNKERHADRQEVEDFWIEIQNVIFDGDYKEIKKMKRSNNRIESDKLIKEILKKMSLLQACEVIFHNMEREPSEVYWGLDDAVSVLIRGASKVLKEGDFEDMVKKRLIKYDRVDYADEVPF
jgi:hypothetical protein